MPTLSFFLYLLILAFAYGFRTIYLGWFGPYLVATVVAVPLLMVLLSMPSILRFRLAIQAPSHVSRGAECSYRILFFCPGLLPIRKILLWTEIENPFTGEITQEKYSFLSIQSSEALIPLPTDVCGKLTIRVTCCQCRDLLGLFTFHRPLCPAVQCAVLPRPETPEPPLNLEAILNAAPKWKPKHGGGFSEEHDLRPYHPGDPTNAIHWKLSSKMDAPIVREALERKDKEVFLILSRPAFQDSSLEHLYWLSLALCTMELPHSIVSDAIYPVENEEDTLSALSSILSQPARKPIACDTQGARCVFLLSGKEVRIQ